MAGSLGELVISLTAETASFHSSLDKAVASLDRAAGSINSGLGTIVAGFQALAGAAAVTTFVDFIHSTNESTASLLRMAERAGTTAEAISALVPAAALSGTGLDQVVTASGKFSKSLVEVESGSGAASRAFAALGFSAADAARMLKDPAAGMLEFAKRLDEFDDGGQKTAAVMALLGKGGAELIPFLKELAKQSELNATTTNEHALAARELEDEFTKLGLSSKQLKASFVAELVPALTLIVKTFADVASGSEGLRSEAMKLIAEGKIAEWADSAALGLAEFADAVTDEINVIHLMGMEVAFAITSLLDLARVAAAGATMFTDPIGSMKAMQAAYASFQGSLAAVKAEWDKPTSTKFVDALFKQQVAARQATEAIVSTKGAVAGLGEAHKTAASDADKFIASLQAEVDKLGLDTYEQKRNEAARLGVSAAANDLIARLQEGAAVQADNTARIRDAAVAEKTYFDSIGAVINAQSKRTEAGLADLAALRLELATIGLTDSQRQIYIATLELQAAAQRDAADSTLDTRAEVERLTEKLGLLNDIAASTALVDAAKKAAEEWQRTADSITNTLTDALMRAFEGGKDWAKNFIESLKSMFAQLVLRPIIQGLVAPLAGGIASLIPGVANAAGGGAGGGNLLGSIGTALGSGGLGIGDALGNLSTIIPTLLETGSVSSAFAGMGASFAAVAPYAAIAAIAIPLIMSALSQGGGPKIGGAASNIPGFNLYPGETTTESNKTISDVVAATQAGYTALVMALGGKGTAAFGLSFDTDPQGSAQNRISAGATVNGQSVYNIRDLNVGRDDAALQARLQIEAKRSLLAALQASEFPTDIAAILDSIAASSATADAIDRVLAYASAVGVVNTAVANIANIGPDLDKLATNSVASAFAAQGAALQALMDDYAGSVDETNALSAATQSYYNSLVQLIAQIKQVEAAVDAMFATSKESIFLSGRDNAFLFAYNQQKQLDTLSTLGGLSDPAAIQAAGKAINDSILAAWGALSPEQQTTNRDWFLDMLTQGQAAVDARLAQIQDAAATQAKTQLDQVHDLLMAAAGTFQAAAVTIDNAANTPLQVEATATISVIVDDERVTAQQVFAS